MKIDYILLHSIKIEPTLPFHGFHHSFFTILLLKGENPQYLFGYFSWINHTVQIEIGFSPICIGKIFAYIFKNVLIEFVKYIYIHFNLNIGKQYITKKMTDGHLKLKTICNQFSPSPLTSCLSLLRIHKLWHALASLGCVQTLIILASISLQTFPQHETLADLPLNRWQMLLLRLYLALQLRCFGNPTSNAKWFIRNRLQGENTRTNG